MLSTIKTLAPTKSPHHAAVMIIGPNGSGKTRIAYELARRCGAEVINLDRTYLYRHFPVTTGLQDTLKEQGVRRHLYEVLDPDEASYDNPTFLRLVSESIHKISSRGPVIIAEGGSTQYVPALLKDPCSMSHFTHVYGIRFPNQVLSKEFFGARVEKAFADGMVHEIEQNLDLFQRSHLIQHCHAAIPTIDYLRGQLTLAQAKESIMERCKMYAEYQIDLFSKFNHVKWIEGGNRNNAVSSILTDLSRNTSH